MSVIQQVYLAESGSSIYIKGIKPDKENYAMYGLPLFKATAVKYGWENPIGDDNGDEEFYNE